MCFGFLRPLSRKAGSASWILRTGVIWQGTPTKHTRRSPRRSTSASARSFGQYVYQEPALAIASAGVVTTRGRGAAGRDDGAVEEPLAQAVAEERGDHPAVLAAREDLRVGAARGDDAAVAAEEPLV